MWLIVEQKAFASRARTSIRRIRSTENNMHPIFAILTVIVPLTLGDVARAHQQVDVITVGGYVKKPGRFERIEKESLAALLNRIGGIPASQAELERYQRGETGLRVRINLYRDGTKREFKIDPKSNELWELMIIKNDTIEVVRAELFEEAEYPFTITLKKHAEQGGADRPTTAPESKSEGSDNPQPEAEGRSR